MQLLYIALVLLLNVHLSAQDYEIEALDESQNRLPCSIVYPMLNIDSCKNTRAKNQKECSDRELLNFIYANLLSPKEKTAGIVVISFIVDENGVIVEEKIVKKLSKECDQEAMRVFQKLKAKYGKWIPAHCQGKRERVKLNIPFRFRNEKKH